MLKGKGLGSWKTLRLGGREAKRHGCTEAVNLGGFEVRPESSDAGGKLQRHRQIIAFQFYGLRAFQLTSLIAFSLPSLPAKNKEIP
jgi:hypothetical protein